MDLSNNNWTVKVNKIKGYNMADGKQDPWYEEVAGTAPDAPVDNGGGDGGTGVDPSTVVLKADKATGIDVDNGVVNKWVDSALLKASFEGIAHTSITGIDLKPTGIANTFVVEITWVDEAGVTKVNTDSTPISIDPTHELTQAEAEDKDSTVFGTISGVLLDKAIKKFGSIFTEVIIPANTKDSEGNIIPISTGYSITNNGITLLYGDGVLYTRVGTDTYKRINSGTVEDTVVDNAVNSFDATLISNDAISITYTGGVLKLKDDSGTIVDYNSGDFIQAGTYTIYSTDPIDNVKFIDAVFGGCVDIHIESNTDQITADYMFADCFTLTKFTASATAFNKTVNMNFTWIGCIALTTFPLLDTSSVTSMKYTWANCTALTSFPAIDTSKVIFIDYAWSSCEMITVFPLIDISEVLDISYTWSDCISLVTIQGLINNGIPIITTTNAFYNTVALSSPIEDQFAGIYAGNTFLSAN